jgi:hypothetical protein
MQEDKKNDKKKLNFKEFSKQEKNNLVGAFVWLIEQDKKQNPAHYKLKIEKND